MCGIAGIIGEIGQEQAKAALARMVAAQSHRGPDDAGTISMPTSQGSVALGHRRLAILDLTTRAHQPMQNAATGDVIVYNGELYNFRELRSQLQAEGLSFVTDSDTEVVLRAFELWGTACLDRFRGMYAFALWVPRTERVWLVRDHAGIKPLYCAARTRGGLLFASEVNALVASGLFDPSLDRRALAGFLAYGSVQAPLTLYRGVESVDPGGWVEVEPTGRVVSRHRYWSLPMPELAGGKPPSALGHELREILTASIRRHLVSDVPVAVFLSSGLDSTCVAGLAHEIAGDSIQSVTVTFADEPDHNEGEIAAQTARRFRLVHTECPVSEKTVLAWVAQALGSMDQPSMDGLNVYIVSRAVREHGIKVALSGQGGDELFGGYESFSQVPMLYRMGRRLGWLPPAARGKLAKAVGPFVGAARREKLADLLSAGADLAALYFHRRRACSNSQLAALGFDSRSLALSPSFGPAEDAERGCIVAGDDIASIARFETTYYLHNTLLRDGDAFSMANSIEVRVPLLDRDVMSWVFKQPGPVMMPPGRATKYLLRQACADLYPEELDRQKKRGFVVPLGRWMRGPLAKTVAEGLSALRESNLVDNRGVDAIVRGYEREPETPIWSRLWTMVVLGHWLERQRSLAIPRR